MQRGVHEVLTCRFAPRVNSLAQLVLALHPLDGSAPELRACQFTIERTWTASTRNGRTELCHWGASRLRCICASVPMILVSAGWCAFADCAWLSDANPASDGSSINLLTNRQLFR